MAPPTERRKFGPIGTLIGRTRLGATSVFGVHATGATDIGLPLVEVTCPCGGVIHNLTHEQATELGTTLITAAIVAKGQRT